MSQSWGLIHIKIDRIPAQSYHLTGRKTSRKSYEPVAQIFAPRRDFCLRRRLRRSHLIAAEGVLPEVRDIGVDLPSAGAFLLRCSCAHCAGSDVLRFSISVPCLSQSHRMSPPTSISARRCRRRVQILQDMSWSTAPKGARVCWSTWSDGDAACWFLVVKT